VIVRIFKLGTSNGEAPVNYLLSMKDHTGQPREVAPEVREGHPATAIAVINGIQRKHRYVSGVLVFRDKMRQAASRCTGGTVSPGHLPVPSRTCTDLSSDS